MYLCISSWITLNFGVSLSCYFFASCYCIRCWNPFNYFESRWYILVKLIQHLDWRLIYIFVPELWGFVSIAVLVVECVLFGDLICFHGFLRESSYSLKDYYKVLEVDYDATDEKIKLSYRKLALVSCYSNSSFTCLDLN